MFDREIDVWNRGAFARPPFYSFGTSRVVHTQHLSKTRSLLERIESSFPQPLRPRRGDPSHAPRGRRTRAGRLEEPSRLLAEDLSRGDDVRERAPGGDVDDGESRGIARLHARAFRLHHLAVGSGAAVVLVHGGGEAEAAGEKARRGVDAHDLMDRRSWGTRCQKRVEGSRRTSRTFRRRSCFSPTLVAVFDFSTGVFEFVRTANDRARG